MKTFYSVFLLVFISLSFNAHAQDEKKKKFLKDPADQATMDSAEFFYQEKNYHIAMGKYKRLCETFPDEKILHFRIGVCQLNMQEAMEEALVHFEKLDEKAFEREQSLYYRARALMMNYRFEEAIPLFEKYKEQKWSTFEFRFLSDIYITNCKNGIELLKQPVEAKIENIGLPVNTSASEYVPLINSEGSVLIYTYRGPRSTGGIQRSTNRNSVEAGSYDEDIFISNFDPATGAWSAPEPLPFPINTKANDASVYLSDDGHELYMFRSVDGDEGSLYVSHLEGTEWSSPEKLYGKINSPWWEGSISISADGRTAYFSSERPGGFGGKDIYVAQLQSDGSWGNIRNAGPKINTHKDDDSPFIHPSGQFITFSSQGHNSMGGYDIYRCDLTNDSTWSDPINMGFPINTPGDDIFFVITGDAQAAYYSSGKAGGYGKQDIYKIIPGIFGKQIRMIRVKGVVTVDDKPAASEIRITYEYTGVTQGIYTGNSASGKYLINLPSDKELVIYFKAEGFEPQLRKINTKDVEAFLETTIDVQFYTDEYLRKLKSNGDSLKTIATNDSTLKTNTSGTDDLFSKFGTTRVEGLRFHVQIGAYNMPQNFNYSTVMKLGKVEKQKLDDNITRFVIGTFETWAEAKEFCRLVIKAGISDAFVTAEYQGKRYHIHELVEKGIFQP